MLRQCSLEAQLEPSEIPFSSPQPQIPNSNKLPVSNSGNHQIAQIVTQQQQLGIVPVVTSLNLAPQVQRPQVILHSILEVINIKTKLKQMIFNFI